MPGRQNYVARRQHILTLRTTIAAQGRVNRCRYSQVSVVVVVTTGWLCTVTVVTLVPG